MLLLTQSLLTAAGFEYDEIEERWVARAPVRPLVRADCDEPRAYITQALAEVRSILKACGSTCTRFTINGRGV
jgi:hypothetical protein